MSTEWMDERPDPGPPRHDPYGYHAEGRNEFYNGREAVIYRRNALSEKWGIQFDIGSFLLNPNEDESVISPIGIVVKKTFAKDGSVLYWVLKQATFVGSIR